MRALPLLAGLAAAIAFGGALSSTGPADAQSNYRTRTIVVFGNDECPKATNPDEIIVCARRPEEERYRIPKTLREEEKAEALAREDNVAANRAALVSGREMRSASGIGSCSGVGPGGATGCTRGLDVMGAGRTILEGAETALEPTDD